MKFKFKKGASVFSSDVYYDLFDGGYIKPEELLQDLEQAKKVNEAIQLVKDFLNEAIAMNYVEVE